jgi:bifunctional UDP-N-acetylglucosamine pyrophosphorylase/glucosamine-1-phosphate N-acetyltransferase
VWNLLSLNHQLLKKINSYRDPSAEVDDTAIIDESRGAVHIGANATVHAFARIVGPCYIGRDTLVGDYSHVRNSSLEAGATVGAYSEVVRSILLPKSSIHQSYLADSILGFKSQVGAGLITANKRFDRQPVSTKIKGKMVESDVTAFGTVLGHHSKLGIGVRTMPGVLIGSQSLVYPSSTLYHNVDHQETFGQPPK